MLVSVNWVKDFVDLHGVSREELAERVTLGTCEVDAVASPPLLWSQVKSVEVVDVQAHPNADNLHLVTASAGGEKIEVVCGANNLYRGMKTIWAPVGTQMTTDFQLVAKSIRGIVSQGMLCSERELGIGDDHDGIIELEPDAAVGECLESLMKSEDDAILDIDNKSLTHRPDLWGIYGMARECAVLFNRALRPAFSTAWQQQKLEQFHHDQPSPLRLCNEGVSALIAYTGLSIEGVSVGPSPLWMQGRLLAAGVRPINRLVDISNYVMLEMGQPNHIFDLDSLQGDELCIYRLQKDEEFVTLDGQARQLRAGDTVIADQAGPQVLAGIMGGLHSSVSTKTNRIFIEVASWTASDIRRTSVRLGLRSDSSLRYEKSLDPYQLTPTLLRLTELVLQLCPGAKVVGQIEWAHPLPPWHSPLIELSTKLVSERLSCALPQERITRILRSLEFGVQEADDVLHVSVPSFRATRDVTLDVDLIEEVGRIVGYNNIAPQPPYVRLQRAPQLPCRAQEWQMRSYLAHAARMQESFSYPLVGAELLRQCAWPQDNAALTVLHPLSPQMDRLRPSLIPNALASVAANLALHPFPRYRVFELGRSYLPDSAHFCRECYQVLMLCFDQQHSPFVEMREIVEGLLAKLRYPLSVTERPSVPGDLLPTDWDGLHSSEFLSLGDAEGKGHGVILSVHPRLLQRLRIRGRVSLAVLDYSAFRQQRWPDGVRFQAPSRFPSSLFDCSVKVKKKVPVAHVLDSLRAITKEGLLREAKIVTIFPLDDTHNSLTLRCTFRSDQATLSSAQLEQLKDRVVASLNAAGYPLKVETQGTR